MNTKSRQKIVVQLNLVHVDRLEVQLNKNKINSILKYILNLLKPWLPWSLGYPGALGTLEPGVPWSLRYPGATKLNLEF